MVKKEPYKDWIVRYYGSHKDIPPGHTDGELTELIRCKNCKYWLPHSQFGFDEDNDEYYDYCELLVPDDDYYAITRQAEDYCSRAERKEK